MRKFAAFMLVTVLALGFAGCAQPAPPKPPEPPKEMPKAADAPKVDAPKEEPKKDAK